MPTPDGPQFAHLTDDELFKKLISAHRRINNLESRYGGVIENKPEPMVRPSDSWWGKKEKLLNEKHAIREELQKRKSGDY